MRKLLIILLAGIFVAGCSSNDNDNANADNGNNNNDNQTEENDNGNEESNAEEDEESDEGNEGDENVSGAVAPKSSSGTVSFEQVSWIGGSPDRQADPGIWFYTEEEHPEKYDDTFDWEEKDILLWQIGDSQYQGYDADTAKLEVMDDDVIKIVVELEENDTDDERAPRNYLKVPKGDLEGKSFIVETNDGERLSAE